MGVQTKSKMNWLQRHLPDGLPVDAAWLERQGYSRSLRQKYALHGWLAPPGGGVSRRPVARLSSADDTRLRWQDVVISLQSLLQRPFSVGGRTALEVQGFGHYLSAA